MDEMRFIRLMTKELLEAKYGPNTGSTSTKNKEIIEEEVFRIISNIVTTSTNDYAMTLVGPTDGLDRHIQEFLSIGIPPNRLIIVEREPSLYRNLLDAKNKGGYSFQLINDDFIEALKQKLNEGLSFSFVDFDGTDGFDYSHLNLINIFNQYKNKIKAIRILGDVRRDSEDFKKYLTNNNDKKGIYSPKNKSKIAHYIFNNKDKLKNFSQEDINKILKSVKTGIKPKSENGSGYFQIYIKDALPSDILFSSYIEKEFGLNCLLNNYRGRGRTNLFNIIISKKDMSSISSDYFKNIKSLQQMKTTEIQIGNKKILIFKQNQDGFKKMQKLRTKFFLIDGAIYHKDYGYLMDYKE